MAVPRNWAGPARAVDAFAAKADALAVRAAIGAPVENMSAQGGAPDWYHPGRSGAIKPGDRVMAHFGELHQEITTSAGLRGPVAAFEVFLDAPPLPKAKATKARPKLVLSPFQPVERDFAFLVDDSVEAEKVVRAARNADKALITSARVFDLYAGKSTMADRMLVRCGAVTDREFHAQMLDSMDIGRERGITIKAQTVRLDYPALDGKPYVLNLMDTPGHVDFAYEVSRSLAACEGSLLVVDASQGVEAQTLANVYQAIEDNHEIVPVLNKMDLPAAEPERVRQQIEDVIGLDASNAIEISAKTGLNIDRVLEALVHRLPTPKGDAEAPLKALLVDSWYESSLGVVILVRVKDGVLKPGLKIRIMATVASHPTERGGVFPPTGVAGPDPGAGDGALGRLSDPSHQRRGDVAAQSGRHARPHAHRSHRGAVDQGNHPGARRISRRRAGAVRGAARRAEGPDLCRQPRHGGLPPAAQRSRVRFLRPAQIDQPRLCQLRLPDGRLQRGRSRPHEHPRQ